MYLQLLYNVLKYELNVYILLIKAEQEVKVIWFDFLLNVPWTYFKSFIK